MKSYVGLALAGVVIGCTAADFSARERASVEGAGSEAGDLGSGGGSSGAPDVGGTGGTSTAKVLCEPGATQACYGTGRCLGAQVCADDGYSWRLCECAESSGGTGGGAAGAGGAATAGKGGASSLGGTGSAGRVDASGAGGSSPVAGMAGTGGYESIAGGGGTTGMPSFCNATPAPIALDCSGVCQKVSFACDDTACSDTLLKSYTLKTSGAIDEVILPPDVLKPAVGCAECPAIPSNITGQTEPATTLYSLAISIRNSSGAAAWFKVTSPGFGVYNSVDLPDDGICGTHYTYTRCGGNELPANAQLTVRLYARELPTPQTHWIRVEAQQQQWSDWGNCSPMPLDSGL